MLWDWLSIWRPYWFYLKLYGVWSEAYLLHVSLVKFIKKVIGVFRRWAITLFLTTTNCSAAKVSIRWKTLIRIKRITSTLIIIIGLFCSQYFYGKAQLYKSFLKTWMGNNAIPLYNKTLKNSYQLAVWWSRLRVGTFAFLRFY